MNETGGAGVRPELHVVADCYSTPDVFTGPDAETLRGVIMGDPGASVFIERLRRRRGIESTVPTEVISFQEADRIVRQRVVIPTLIVVGAVTAAVVYRLHSRH